MEQAQTDIETMNSYRLGRYSVASIWGTLILAILFMLALFGLRKQRNLSVYFLITFAILFLVAWGGVWAATFFVGRAMLMQGAFYLSYLVEPGYSPFERIDHKPKEQFA